MAHYRQSRHRKRRSRRRCPFQPCAQNRCIFYFFDGSAISAVQLDHCLKWDVSWRGRESSTPFWLFQKAETWPCLDFETVDPAELIACDWADLVWVTAEDLP
jgi:hypothetical protein